MTQIIQKMTQEEKDKSLVKAVCECNASAVKKALSFGADPNTTVINHYGYTSTVLIDACRNVSLKIVKMLLKAGADPNKRSNFGRFPLVFATLKNSCEIVSLLLDYGANVNMRDELNSSALHYSMQQGNINISKMLIEAGIDLNTIDRDRWTPLMYGAARGNIDAIEALYNVGADINLVNTTGHTALDILEIMYPDRYKLFINRQMLVKEDVVMIEKVHSEPDFSI